MGEQTLTKALHAYFMKYRFTHPTQEDFMRTVNEVSGRDLKWFWDQAVYGTQMLDYEVSRADSNPGTGTTTRLRRKRARPAYETQVLLHRKDDFVFPVEAVVKFDNGETVCERWDGKERWVRYVYQKKAKVHRCRSIPTTRSRWITTT